MSMPSASNYHRSKSRDVYHPSPSMGPSSGFLTPPSPYNIEARRDSIASSQSSMSSFTTYSSDYSMPVTPTCGRSPLSEESFVDVMASYDMSHDLQNQPLHGLPISPQQKHLASDDTAYDQWTMIQHPVEGMQAIPVQTHEALPPTGSFLQSHIADHTGLEGVMVSSADSSFNFSTVGYPHLSRQLDSHLANHIDPSENLQALWASQIQQSQGNMAMQTMIPSDAMLDVEEDYAHIHQEPFSDPNTFDEANISFPPSPQEVCYKRESPVPVKQEPDLSDGEGQLTRSIYVSPTGGKSVKKERRSGSVSKRKAQRMRRKEYIAQFRNGHIAFSTEDFNITRGGFEGIVQDEETGKWKRTDGTNSNPHQCDMLNSDGTPCERKFKRPEHLKRHVQTHLGRRDFSCEICSKPFNRNDNCQEHYWTHVRRPGKKDGRNKKFSLLEVESNIQDPKLIEKLRQKWRNEVGKDWKIELDTDSA